jgi:cysteine desulfurase family protein
MGAAMTGMTGQPGSTPRRPRPVYLDNASTASPKATGVWEAIRDYLADVGVSPGRSSYRLARSADAMVYQTRELVAGLIKADDPTKVAFTANATTALNACIKGFLGDGEHVVTTATEHNSVLRPLERLRRDGRIELTVVKPGPGGEFDLADFAAATRSNTSLFVLNHASNVTGAVVPVRDVSTIAHEHGAVLLVDAAQTAGYLPIDVRHDGIDMLVFTGHKCLLGPSGTGGMYIAEPGRVATLIEGGTGLNSQSLRHPAMMPTKFEAGTANYLGIAGLRVALAHVVEAQPAVRVRAEKVLQYCLDALSTVATATVHTVRPGIEQVPIVSFNLVGFFAGELSAVLDEHFGIMTRPGLHCAPFMHAVLGTIPHGTVRVSIGHDTTVADIDQLLYALREIEADPGRFVT